MQPMGNILVDINHPAHVHLFKHFITEMQQRGFNVWVTVKEIPAAITLLKKYHIPYIHIGSKRDTMRGKIVDQMKQNFEVFKIVKRENIRFGVGSSVSLAHVSRFTDMTSFIFDDDDSTAQPLFARLVHPFADFIVSPDALSHADNRILYKGYHELAYLHPNRFRPDAGVLKDAGVEQQERFFVLRFNAFKAHHDLGARGIPLDKKVELVELLRRHGRVFITAERELEPELNRYRLSIPPEQIHSFLYYAALFVGDSQTMTSEAAVLGTPAVKCNSFVGRLSIPNELEQRYRLCYGFTPDRWPDLLQRVALLANDAGAKHEHRDRLQRLLTDKIDVTAFMVWLIASYPESIDILRGQPDYQDSFKARLPVLSTP